MGKKLALGTAASLSRAKRMLRSGALDVEFLLRDEFTDTLAAGSVNGTPAVPGPGTRTVIDTGSKLSLAGGELVFAGDTDPGDPRYTLDKQTQAAGLAAIWLKTTGNYITTVLGWDGSTTGPIEVLSYRFQSVDVVEVYISGSRTGSIGSHKDRAAIILRSTGAFFVVDSDGAGAWQLWWVADSGSLGANAYPGVSSKAGNPSPHFDWFRVAQLSAPWDADNGLATDDSLSGARSAGDTFTHEADCLIEFEATTVPSGDQIEVEFRQQTPNTDCWRVTIDSAGTIDLDEIVSGGDTQRGSSAAGLSGGERIMIVADDDDISVFNNLLEAFVYVIATNFKTETDGELETEGTAGSVSDIISWPRTLSGEALGQINKYAS